MLFNPWVILVAVALLFSGIGIGYKWSERANAAQLLAATNQAIAGANAATEAEVKRTVEAARVEAARRLASATARLKGERDAALKSKPECSRDADSMRLLNESIAVANGDQAASKQLPDSVRSGSAASERDGP